MACYRIDYQEPFELGVSMIIEMAAVSMIIEMAAIVGDSMIFQPLQYFHGEAHALVCRVGCRGSEKSLDMQKQVLSLQQRVLMTHKFKPLIFLDALVMKKSEILHCTFLGVPRNVSIKSNGQKWGGDDIVFQALKEFSSPCNSLCTQPKKLIDVLVTADLMVGFDDSCSEKVVCFFCLFWLKVMILAAGAEVSF